ncbi:MAG: DUF3943 domain-containing protein [Bacteroidota bacterium]|nr:DUF3943 domain-containing protein [Bacteroidota bacterium]
MKNLCIFVPARTFIAQSAVKSVVHKKLIFTWCLAFLITTGAFAQKTNPTDTIKPGNGPVKQQLKDIKAAKKTITDSTGGAAPKKSALIDTTIQNKYGDLLNDDIKYNKKYPAWKPALEVLGNNVFTWSIDRFLLNADFSHIGPSTWKYNIQKGWEWDADRFGVNFVAHPYSGSMYFNAARSQGYNYFQSVPFAVGGSLMWEYLAKIPGPLTMT